MKTDYKILLEIDEENDDLNVDRHSFGVYRKDDNKKIGYLESYVIHDYNPDSDLLEFDHVAQDVSDVASFFNEKAKGKDFFIIDIIRVEEKYRNQGIAQELMARFIDNVRLHCFSDRWIIGGSLPSRKETYSDRKFLADFYKRFGFKVIKNKETDTHFIELKGDMRQKAKKDDLYIGLKKGIRNDKVLGFKILHHPFVIQLPYIEEHNHIYNKMYDYKQKKINESLHKKDNDSYVFLHERPYRLSAFVNLYGANVLKGEQYWDLLSRVWIDCEEPHINLETWIILFSMREDKKEHLMSNEEREHLDSLGDSFEIFRGQQGNEVDGISWTLDKKVAEFFANRWDKKGKVFRRRVKRDHVIAYLSFRGEKEIIYFHPSIRNGVKR